MPGRLIHSPALVVKQLIIDYGLGSDPENDALADAEYDLWPVFRGREPDRPDDLVKTTDTTPRGEGDVQLDGEHQCHEGIQVFVRSADYGRGYAKVNQLCDFLDRVNRAFVTLPQTSDTDIDSEVPGTGGVQYLVAACTRSSGPGPTGPDTPQGKRLTFTANYVVSIRLCQ